jgi:hypothetical protein
MSGTADGGDRFTNRPAQAQQHAPGPPDGVTARPLPPWELPGAFRCDCEPHRAFILRLWGRVALMAGFLSIFLYLPALAALPAGAAVYVLARQDLARMRAGLMDPQGENATWAAMGEAAGAVLLSLWGASSGAFVALSLLR